MQRFFGSGSNILDMPKAFGPAPTFLFPRTSVSGFIGCPPLLLLSSSPLLLLPLLCCTSSAAPPLLHFLCLHLLLHLLRYLVCLTSAASPLLPRLSHLKIAIGYGALMTMNCQFQMLLLYTPKGSDHKPQKAPILHPKRLLLYTPKGSYYTPPNRGRLLNCGPPSPDAVFREVSGGPYHKGAPSPLQSLRVLAHIRK